MKITKYDITYPSLWFSLPCTLPPIRLLRQQHRKNRHRDKIRLAKWSCSQKILTNRNYRKDLGLFWAGVHLCWLLLTVRDDPNKGYTLIKQPIVLAREIEPQNCMDHSPELACCALICGVKWIIKSFIWSIKEVSELVNFGCRFLNAPFCTRNILWITTSPNRSLYGGS